MIGYTFYDSDTRLIQYAHALAERGDTVDVICLRHPGQIATELIDGVNIYRIQERTKNEKGKFAYLARIVRFLFHSMLVLARRHRAVHYDLVHVHSVPDFLVFAALVPKLQGTPTILDIHDILPEFYCSKFGTSNGSLMFRLLVLVERASIAFADHVIVANELWRPRLVQRSCPPEKCTSICNYPDPNIFYERPKRNSKGKFVILYPGTLNWHQGVDIAIRAFATAAAEIGDAEFHIYGDGPAKPALVSLASELGLNGRVKFHGTVPLREVPQLMADADVGVVPKRAASAFGNEAISTKVLQFMAMGVPVILSRTTVDLHYHNDSRVRFVDSEDVADFAEAMIALRRDTLLRTRLANNAREYVLKNNWNVRKAEYLQVVDQLYSGAHAEHARSAGQS